jgi:hypothetical protein
MLVLPVNLAVEGFDEQAVRFPLSKNFRML